MDGAALLFLAASQVSPLEDTSGALGLTLSNIAKGLGHSEAAANSLLSGSRTAPTAVCFLLGTRDPGVRREQWIERTRRRRLRGAVNGEIAAKLPAGVSMEQAKEAAARAISNLMGGAP